MIYFNDLNVSATDRNRFEGIFSDVVASGHYILGKNVDNFEKAWSAYCGVKYGIGVANGMDAIEIILRCLKIGPGDEVVTTSMTAFATVLAIYRAGATPVLADIDFDTGLMDPASLKRCITQSTKAVVYVELYGQLGPISEIQDICNSSSIFLIEDCAQAHGAHSKGKMSGSYGIAAAFSFYPTKNLGTFGDAGMIVSDSNALNEMARMMRNYGQSSRYHHEFMGLNSRLDEMHAALLLDKLNSLEHENDHRNKVAERYYRGLSDLETIKCLEPNHENHNVYHLFVIRSSRRQELQAYLNKAGVQTLIHYPIPIHHQAPCKSMRRDPVGMSNVEKFAEQCLSLPCNPNISLNDVEKVVDALRSFK